MTTAHGRLMLTMLGGLVELERDLILACAPASVAS
jgi:DNA invertase Pin-like site-specific DNA recombinase